MDTTYTREDQNPTPFEREFDLSLFPDKGELGRNDPCPCRSGKKYKRCCGSSQPPKRSELNIERSAFLGRAPYDLYQPDVLTSETIRQAKKMLSECAVKRPTFYLICPFCGDEFDQHTDSQLVECLGRFGVTPASVPDVRLSIRELKSVQN